MEQLTWWQLNSVDQGMVNFVNPQEMRLTPKVVHPYLVFIVLPGTTISGILSP